MRRFLLRRVGLMLLTLLIVSLIVFILSRIVPGDIGRVILGPYAGRGQVAAMDHRLGYDQPLLVQYWNWLHNFLTGNWGTSILYGTSVSSLVGARLVASLQLAAVAMIIIVPVSIMAGVAAGLREGGVTDRLITTVGLSLTAIPEFVSGVILLVIFGVSLNLFPVTAQFAPGAGILDRIHHLFLAAVPLMFVLFGYIARMARFGTLEVVESPYYRTAVLKGLPRRRIVWRHVLRNALPPTVTVVGVQIGFLVGGLVVVETLFNYPGLGSLLLETATGHDVPTLEATALVIGTIIMISNLVADISYGLLTPRVRLGDD